ncbi:hypothetical protein ASE01_04495 [Nocardioides sp. Root190]|uniref:aldose epimerase family protein n=1 Tax=Nocardioides sp. Root190 TaxID=1736488 RepID=UPI0006FDA835|nr:aldose epimerase family protein [Nocardioides sp. Root190]KRB78525.1 hypothetical protein ASE01_04495 [Nocardioides sp. Root190]
MTDPGAIVLGGAPGPELHLLEVGATVQRLVVTGGDGVRRDVALGLADGAAVRASRLYVGSVVGRYANRIARGRFELDGIEHELPLNDRGHHLHGGPEGFHTRAWTLVERTATSATFELVSPAGDAGYPGEVTARASYDVAEHCVVLELTATTTAPTLVNLTSHVYLNLHGAGPVDDHVVQVPAGSYLPVDEVAIPTGDLASVEGTRFDLRTPVRVGDIGGLDHDFAPDGSGWQRHVTLEAPGTRTRVEIWSDQPGLQVFTADGFDGSEVDRDGVPLGRCAGIALEPQLHPDSPHHPGWPSAVLRPGETYRHRIEWRFSSIGSIQ